MRKWVLLFFVLLLSGCSSIKVLSPQSDTGKDQAFLIWFSLGIMLLVLAVVFVLWGRFIWKYAAKRQRDNPNLPTDVKGNRLYETLWTVIPILLLAILAVPTIVTTYNQSPVSSADKTKSHLNPDDGGVHIEVTGQQFYWTFKHKGGKEVKHTLVLPANKHVYFHLKSKDVIHSFWIPKLAGKTDVMPHEELIYEIKNAQPGTYMGKCAEYCGVGHADMRFTAKVVSEKTYEAYVKDK